LSKPTRLEQQKIILKLFSYRLCGPHRQRRIEAKGATGCHALDAAGLYPREVLQYLENHRIVIPGYTFLQDMVGRVVTGERRRITQLLDEALTPTMEKQLARLLEADNGMYRISVLKHEPKDFSYKQMQQEVARRKFFQPLYNSPILFS
jgi:hypothetical protein